MLKICIHNHDSPRSLPNQNTLFANLNNAIQRMIGTKHTTIIPLLHKSKLAHHNGTHRATTMDDLSLNFDDCYQSVS